MLDFPRHASSEACGLRWKGIICILLSACPAEAIEPAIPLEA
jgi:hypothetical protein